MAKWIDIRDKMPPDNLKVLVNLSNGDVKKAYRNPCGEWSNGYDVTHWQNVDVMSEIFEILDKLEEKLTK
ncbi:hypothetical protein [Pedobacter aquatilis]|uniref:hypothetical protein n=1 Tax=Pedobacter aquatilis TaxID=351343 RepID=UPI00292E8BC5|nr:hypothetical protein [Pedobacter aquatilis]